MTENTPKLLRDYCLSLEEVFYKRDHKPELPLITLDSINKIIWGIPKKKMTIIAGRTSHAKSTMAINIAYDLAKQGHSVLFMSLEMSAESILERIFCYEKKVPNIDIQRGKFNQYLSEWAEFKQFVSKIPFVLDNNIGRTIKEIHSYLNQLDRKPEVLIIDHIQEIETIGIDKKDSIDKYLKNMRELAIKNNFAFICCSQINRMTQDEKDKRPRLHQLKCSGAIEEMADLVLLLYWHYQYDKTADIGKFELNIAKNRDGMTGFVDLRYFPQFCRFEDVKDESVILEKQIVKQAFNEVDFDE